MSTDHHFNFSPSDILPSTFSHLLSLYPKTAQTVFETKLRAKSKKATEQDIKSQVNAFVELDNWRYETLPTTLIERWGVDAKGLRTAKRAKAAQDVSTQTSSGRMYLEKDELVRLMEWKLKHGSFRPALMNLIRSNPESRIYSTTKDALSSLPAFSESSKDGDADASFPNTALDILSKSLRGVGPATASLILSVSTAASPITAQAPFFSDELYWWLCAERYPVLPSLSAEGVSVKGANQTKPVPKLKYTIKEYQELWYALRHFATRLETVSKAPFSMQDIEKVAFVIGHFEHSGYKQAATEVSGSEQANLGTKKEDSNAKEEKSNISSPPVVASTAKPDLGSETTADAQAKRRKRKR